MATVSTPTYASSASPSSPARVVRMENYPENLTAAQQEAQSILKYVLNRLNDPGSKYYRRYGRWVERHSNLEEFCFRCVRPTVWRFLEGRWNLDALKTIGGDLKSEGRGVYFDGVLGLDKRTRIYIGQSFNLRLRIAQHWNFRYRRDNPSLHYHAVQKSIYNVFGILCALPSPNMGNHTLPGMDCPDLLLNVLEMWMCLLLRSLPTQTLEEWLPEGVKAEKNFGMLNIASPLDHGDTEREWVDLSEFSDPLMQDYFWGELDKSNAELVEKRPKDAGYQEKRTGSEMPVIQITAPTLLLVGTALVVGFWLARSVGQGYGPQPRVKWK